MIVKNWNEARAAVEAIAADRNLPIMWGSDGDRPSEPHIQAIAYPEGYYIEFRSPGWIQGRRIMIGE